MATAATSAANLAALQALGQSIWLDDISRTMLNEGELARLIEEDGLQGMTSNPSIFQKAISTGNAYDDETKLLVGQGEGLDGIYQALTVSDIKRALDNFRPVYDRTNGVDGCVSLEVSPLLAHDTHGTIKEAKLLWSLLDRPNAMIKVPGTHEGLPAIEELLYCGINVNVTLLFSLEAYRAVAETYIKALSRRAAEGKSVERIASVASFFISRIDTEVDKRIEAKLKTTTDVATEAKLRHLLGKVAIANAKNSYKVYQDLFEGASFAGLKAKGALVQRLLWASVGTKNPAYPDTLYTAGLIGPETVSTMPRASYDAFRDHGVAATTLTHGMDEAAKDIETLKEVGIDLDNVTDQLLREGVKLFADAFATLFAAVKTKRDSLIKSAHIGSIQVLGEQKDHATDALADLETAGAVKRMWAKDASLWKTDAKHSAIIENSLGWLTVPELVKAHAHELTAFADEIVKAGFEHVVVMGMGGSSLGVEVLRRVNIPMSGHPTMLVLDSTVPATVRRIEAAIDPAKTLFVVSSKSGTTIEPSVFYSYFFDVVKKLKGDKAGENFVAITDPGTKMEGDANRDGFRKIFLNPSDIGGRYSVLSYFGMVPAALMGLDVEAILKNAAVAIKACSPEQPIRQNPGAQLGAIMGGLAKHHRDKLTLVTPAPVEALGLWIEQLVAESTGKEGKGILPVAGELLGSPASYGSDRVFVQIRTLDAPCYEDHPMLKALSDAGHPVVDLVMGDVTDLGGEFFRWEIATPLAGQRLGIDPFDQPNVQESKDNTKALIATYLEKGSLPKGETVAECDGITLRTDAKNAAALTSKVGTATTGEDKFVAILKAHFDRFGKGDYLAITQYFDESDARDHVIQGFRTKLRDKFHVATTTGYGPRFLHSTGQLHKGGPDSGVFLQLTADDGDDLPIPHEKFGFATLVEAQALGDFESLTSRGRRALNVHLGTEVDKSLAKLAELIEKAIA